MNKKQLRKKAIKLQNSDGAASRKIRSMAEAIAEVERKANET